MILNTNKKTFNCHQAKAVNKIYQAAHVEETTCKVCASRLRVRMTVRPCVEHPKGAFEILACDTCSPSKSRQKKNNRKNKQ